MTNPIKEWINEYFIMRTLTPPPPQKHKTPQIKWRCLGGVVTSSCNDK